MNVTFLSIVPFIYLVAFLFLIAGSITNRALFDKIASTVSRMGFILHTTALILRWVESYNLEIGHLPITEFYESLMAFAWCIVLLDLLLEYKRGGRALNLFIIPLAFSIMFYASFSSSVESEIQPLVPALKSNWLAAHVLSSLLGYAGFVCSSISAFVYLLKEKEDDFSILSAFPETKELEKLIYDSMVIGYILFSIGVVAGAAWAYGAWGSYWSWNPKETCALITGLIYTTGLHVRFSFKRGGKKMALISLLGLSSIIMTYFGTDFLPGLHRYF